MKSILVRALILAAALVAAPPAALAQEADTLAPVTSEFEFTPQTVDVSTGAKQITATVRLTDATGAKAPYLIVASDSTTQTAGFGQMTRISGDATNGVYSRTVTIPTTAAPGTWDVRLYPTEDNLGNTDSTFRDHPTKLTVTNGAAAPAAPSNVTAVRGDESAQVTWTAAAANGSAITGYTITSNPGGIIKSVAGDQTTGTIAGLMNGTSYTFTVVATNATGTSPASTPSNAVTPAAAPGAPTSVSATRGDKSATVSWTAPANNGGSPITGYTITSTPGGLTKTVDGSTTTGSVTALTNGTSYTFTVVAINAIGTSPASSPSNAVTPAAETEPDLAPGTPSGFSAKVKGSKAILTWDPPATGDPAVTGYQVTSNKGYDKTLAAGKTKLVLRNLDRGRYTFTLVSSNDSGDSEPTRTKVRIR